MKQIYTLMILILLASTSNGRTPITFNKTSGNWSTPTNWSPIRVPQNSDSVIIPQNRTVIFDQAASYTNMYINVAGILSLKNKMTLDAASIIELKPTGSVTTFSGGNNPNEAIILGGVIKFDQSSNNPTTGPAAATLYSNGFGPISILPVTFAHFYAIKENNDRVNLEWSTSQELNNKSFEVQRSFDDHNWTVIAEITGAGTSNMSHTYHFTDKNISADIIYYRIRQVDAGGSFQFSTQKMIHMSSASASAAKIYAYNKNVTVEFNAPVKNNLLVRVMNMNGQVIAQQNIQQASYKLNVTLSNSNTGVYVVQVTDGKAINESTKVVL